MQCSPCLAGYECVDPPCYGACQQCRPGFWKAAKILYSQFVLGSEIDPLSGKYSRQWVEEPCASCPVNTFRQLSGGTEVGSCTTCPPKSTTAGLLNRTAESDCRCDIFYYAQATSLTSSLTCSDCPQGAVCASDRSCALGLLGPETFVLSNRQSNLSCGNPSDLVYGGWVRNDTGEYRLEYCPPGYTMQKSDFTATADKCIECPPTSYLQDIVYSQSIQCRPCPIGATCPGGSRVIPNSGYWQMPVGRRDSGVVPKARVFKCPPGVCDTGGICLNNRTGPVRSIFWDSAVLQCITIFFCQVCGLCPPGWAFVAKGCSECPAEDKLSPLRKVVIAIFVLVCLTIWYTVSWRPLLSAVKPTVTDESRITTKKVKSEKKTVEGKVKKVEGIKNKIGPGMQTITSVPKKIAHIRKRFVQSLGDDMQEQLEGLTKDRIVQYLKLYITYFQVVSSFLTFSVKWPDLLRNSMLWIKGTLFLDVLQLPGLACLWTGIAFDQRIMTYTLGPLVVSFCLVMPCIFGWLAGYREKKPTQWKAASNAAWKNIMLWVFLVYPVVSLTTLQAFDCQPAGLGLLAADRNLKCPSGGDFLTGWSVAFIFVYPIGIPFFCFISMLGMGVHLIAQDKINANILSSVVAKYMQVTTSVESHRIAGLFKSEDQDNADSKADPEVLSFWTLLNDSGFKRSSTENSTSLFSRN